MFLVLAAVAATVAGPVLAEPAARAAPRDRSSVAAPAPPRGADARSPAPEVELALLDARVGPVLRIGAFGGRHAAAPKLAHIAVGWRF